MAKYEELVEKLVDEFSRGVYKKGERLPTTPQLCQIYGVSNTTIKRAMDVLESYGLVARRRGSGVYVKEVSMPKTSEMHQGSSSQQMTGMTAEYEDTKATIGSDVKEFSVAHPSADMAQSLDMAADEFVYRICRVRTVNGTPKVVEYTFMPINTIPGLREQTLHASIYQFIEHDLGLKIGSAHRTIKAVMPTPNERTWLGIGEGEPLLEVSQIAYLADGTPFEYSVSRHTSDYEFYSISTH